MKRRRSGKSRRQCLDRFALAAGGIVDVVDQHRAGDLHFDRPGKGPLRHAVAGAGLQRKHRIIAGGPGVKQISRAEVRLIMRQRGVCRGAVQPRIEKSCGVEGQQHRHWTAPDASEDRRSHRVQLQQGRHRTRIRRGQPIAAGQCKRGRHRRACLDLGPELVERGAPVDPNRRDRGGPEFVGVRSGAESQQCQARQSRDDQPGQGTADSVVTQAAPGSMRPISPSPLRVRRKIRRRS